MRFWKTFLLPLLCTFLHAEKPNIIVILADDLAARCDVLK